MGLGAFFDVRKATGRRPLGASGQSDDRSLGWVLAQYIAVFLGILAKMYWDDTSGTQRFNLRNFLVAVVAAVLIFPLVLKNSLAQDTTGSRDVQLVTQFCLSFTAGFGYSSLVSKATNAVATAPKVAASIEPLLQAGT